jgi:hypothetical protein
MSTPARYEMTKSVSCVTPQPLIAGAPIIWRSRASTISLGLIRAPMTAWRQRAVKRAGLISIVKECDQEAAARGARLRELRWKNSA